MQKYYLHLLYVQNVAKATITIATTTTTDDLNQSLLDHTVNRSIALVHP